MHLGTRFVLAAAAAAALSPATFGQFNQQAGVMPGPNIWTSGVMTFDAEGDGDLDVFVSNGNGFGSAGTKHPPSLLINTGVSGGNPVFQDQAAARLPAGLTLNAKGAIAFDMENDGDLDVFVSVAFGQSQVLLENDGTGNFTDVTAAKFTTININSWGANAFDMDNDGDRDLAVCDNTGSSLNSNGRMRLFENDGTGTFFEVSTTNIPQTTKSSQQNVTALDIDNDFDLDMVLDGRSTPQRLYINDGTGNFTLLNNVIPAGSSSCYETDWADLDGDGDLDGFYISLSSFNEGTAFNRLIETGSLAFSGGTGTLSGGNGGDDNELLFIDYDDDGDLDPIVSALGQQREKLYRNNGNFTFSLTTAFSFQSDSTLDMTCGDYDGDGDYDAITGQGESGNFANRYYRNDGPADSTPPTVVGTKVADGTGPFVILAKVTDSTMDDGDQFVDCVLNYMVTPLTGSPVSGSVPMRYSGGSIYRGVIAGGLPADLLEATVTYSISATDGVGNQITSPNESFLACGVESFGTGEFSSGGTQAVMSFSGDLTVGGTFVAEVDGANPSSFSFFLAGDNEGNNVQPWGTILVAGPNFTRTTTSTNGAGHGEIDIPVEPVLIGNSRFFQFITRDPGFGGNLQASDAMKVLFCP